MTDFGRLRLQTREAGPALVLDLEGDITLGPETSGLREFLRGKLDDERRPLLLNFAGVRYTDSTGVGVLVEAKAHAIGVGIAMRMFGLPPFVDRILQRIKLHEILEVCPDEAQALESLPQTI